MTGDVGSQFHKLLMGEGQHVKFTYIVIVVHATLKFIKKNYEALREFLINDKNIEVMCEFINFNKYLWRKWFCMLKI